MLVSGSHISQQALKIIIALSHKIVHQLANALFRLNRSMKRKIDKFLSK